MNMQMPCNCPNCPTGPMCEADAKLREEQATALLKSSTAALRLVEQYKAQIADSERKYELVSKELEELKVLASRLLNSMRCGVSDGDRCGGSWSEDCEALLSQAIGLDR